MVRRREDVAAVAARLREQPADRLPRLDGWHRTTSLTWSKPPIIETRGPIRRFASAILASPPSTVA